MLGAGQPPLHRFRLGLEFMIAGHRQMDIAVHAKVARALSALAIPSTDHSTYPSLAASLHMSASEAHGAVKRAAQCGLVDETTRKAKRLALLEFVVHGLRTCSRPAGVGSPGAFPRHTRRRP
jgi:hypothetical protein